MAQIRNYQVGVYETKTLRQIAQVTDGTDQFLKIDSVLTNAFSDLQLYSDSGGVSPLTLGVDYNMTTTDTAATTKEAGTGGSGKTVYSQFEVINATYQNVDLWATCTNFGTYTDNDAAFEQQGGVITVTADAEITIPEGYTSVLVNCDTTSGSITLTSSSAGFAGQRIRVKNSAGTGLVYCKLAGAYLGASSTGTPISPGLIWRGDSDGTTIDPVNEVTADYVSGEHTIKQSSVGVYELITEGSISVSASTSTTNESISYPISFSASPAATIAATSFYGGNQVCGANLQGGTTSNINVYVINLGGANSAGTTTYTIRAIGEY